MLFACPNCASRYSIADEIVADRVLTVVCRKCGQHISVFGVEAPEDGPPVPPQLPPQAVGAPPPLPAGPPPVLAAAVVDADGDEDDDDAYEDDDDDAYEDDDEEGLDERERELRSITTQPWSTVEILAKIEAARAALKEAPAPAIKVDVQSGVAAVAHHEPISLEPTHETVEVLWEDILTVTERSAAADADGRSYVARAERERDAEAKAFGRTKLSQRAPTAEIEPRPPGRRGEPLAEHLAAARLRVEHQKLAQRLLMSRNWLLLLGVVVATAGIGFGVFRLQAEQLEVLSADVVVPSLIGGLSLVISGFGFYALGALAALFDPGDE